MSVFSKTFGGTLFFLIFSLPTVGQIQLETAGLGLIYDLKGAPYHEKKVTITEGSPFLKDEWSRGSIVMLNKRIVQDLNVKLNLETNEVHYLAEDTKLEMIALQGIVSEVILKDTESETIRFKRGFPSYGTNNQRTFYQVLTEGEITLLKLVKKEVIEEKPYNSATYINKYNTKEEYFLFKEEKLIKLKRTKSGILEILNDQRIKLDEFIATNRINLKSDGDLIQLISYYNTI